jgi:gamma-glutamyltranspeptidase/glutathione hydrolase
MTDQPSAACAVDAAPAMRPDIRGTRHVVSSGHYLASQAGFEILEAGGNAVDAGVAAGLALGVVQSEYVNVAGVAPIIIYLAQSREVITISGLGVWPQAADIDVFVHEHGGSIPDGVLRTVVPAAPDAWITALRRYGTMSFGEVAAVATQLASDGFVMYPLMHDIIELHRSDYARWPSSAAIYLPDGEPPKVGERFVQADLGRTLAYMIDEERAAGGGRDDGMLAARDAFYRGDIARTIVDYHQAHGGWLTMADLDHFAVGVEASTSAPFASGTLHTCGPWCQGPVLLQMVRLLEGADLAGMGHNSVAYVHLLVEAMKLAFADREAHYADPRFHDVPLAELLSDRHTEMRRALIDPARATNDVAAGDPHRAGRLAEGSPALAVDTSYVCVIDHHGNAFSATPSDVSADTPVIPGTGLCPSSRGSQSWAVPGHPCAVAPGTRPRLTPNPAMLVSEDVVMPIGTPGGDVQCQAMLQVLLNARVFNMPLQAAIEAPRFATHSFPNSFEPHEYLLGRVTIEGAMPKSTGDALASMGHDVEWWPERTFRAGGVCAATRDPHTGLVTAGADPRRPGYALGW